MTSKLDLVDFEIRRLTIMLRIIIMPLNLRWWSVGKTHESALIIEIPGQRRLMKSSKIAKDWEILHVLTIIAEPEQYCTESLYAHSLNLKLVRVSSQLESDVLMALSKRSTVSRRLRCHRQKHVSMWYNQSSYDQWFYSDHSSMWSIVLWSIVLLSIVRWSVVHKPETRTCDLPDTRHRTYQWVTTPHV